MSNKGAKKAMKHLQENCWPAILVTELGQACDIPAGSLWYPPMERAIEDMLRSGSSHAEIRSHYRLQLGLDR